MILALLSVACLGASYYFCWLHEGWTTGAFWALSVTLELLRQRVSK